LPIANCPLNGGGFIDFSQSAIRGRMMKTILPILALLLLNPVRVLAEPALKIYLPRTAKVTADALTLKDVAILRGQDESLAVKAGAVAMGRSPFSKEQLTLDQRTVLSRLASEGIAAEKVEITGAQQVIVSRDEKAIAGGELVQAALSLLEAQQPPPAGARWQCTGEPKEVMSPRLAEAKLNAKLLSGSVQEGQARLSVSVDAAGKSLASAELAFKLAYTVRRLVAAEEIASGSAVTPQNTRIETVLADKPADSQFGGLYGRVAAGRIAKGAVVTASALKETKPATVVKRNDVVIMKIDGAGFSLTGVGKAMEDGKVGDCIKVKNVQTERVVAAKVAADGSVVPIMDMPRLVGAVEEVKK
jgi:flagella basal body P-ring formation protein FlgA